MKLYIEIIAIIILIFFLFLLAVWFNLTGWLVKRRYLKNERAKSRNKARDDSIVGSNRQSSNTEISLDGTANNNVGEDSKGIGKKRTWKERIFNR
jgi:Na+/melibiose symporter-like transporter